MEKGQIYILGAGAIGMALAVHLRNAGRPVTAVRTSTDDLEAQAVEISLDGSQGGVFTSQVDMVSLAKLNHIAGTIVVTAKAYANRLIASRLRSMDLSAPIVVLQNGVGVEDAYLELDHLRVYRCVLYATGQKRGDNRFTFIPVTASPIGVVRGSQEELEALVGQLNTREFPFVTHTDIRQEVWKKATINAVFNSICTLLEVDNGIFTRDEQAAQLAREIIDECVAIMQRIGVRLSAEDILPQLFAISRRSDGQLISTLQDIHQGRETEIDSLNLEIARIGESMTPPVRAKTTRVLGELVKIKSMLRRN